MKILFIGKENDSNSYIASVRLKSVFPECTVVFGSRGKSFPSELLDWEGDYVFSYLSPWIIPQKLLSQARLGAINWHPGPPEYPGIGCTNFAIYNNESVFGMTCHYMLQKVDTGRIIEVRRFDVLKEDTVFSITQKCYAEILISFFNVIDSIETGKSIPVSNEEWTRKPYTRKELDALSQIQLDMSEDEIERRIKATTYNKPWAFIELKGRKYYLR